MLPDWLKRGHEEPPALDIAGRRLPVAIRRLPQARRLTMRLAPDGSEVRISMPQWARTAEALAFARSREGWLAERLAALPPRHEALPGTLFPWRGEMLAIDHDPRAPRKPQRIEGVLRLGGPVETLSPRIRRWLQSEALDHASADLAHYCRRAMVTQPPLALSDARRRWGSCSARSTIRINWRLIMAPDFVRRSVVAHEVTHLLHFDHGPGFHATLAEIYEGSVAEADRWLKREGTGLYAWFAP
ncbi:MAG TPA: DUF45 domain-containing protein [Novosphingobium sp.]|nr:DUF45 domain-containing protein [Novosphingobium sp.]